MSTDTPHFRWQGFGLTPRLLFSATCNENCRDYDAAGETQDDHPLVPFPVELGHVHF